MNQQSVQTNDRESMLNLYDRYSGMLLGYIFEIVKDKELAEQYMVSVFKDVSDRLHEIYHAENTWARLQQIAKCKLADFFASIKDCDTRVLPDLSNKNNVINLMSDDQRDVFCAVYYHGKTTANVAKQLQKSELEIRKILKEAFAIIRQSREHTGVY